MTTNVVHLPAVSRREKKRYPVGIRAGAVLRAQGPRQRHCREKLVFRPEWFGFGTNLSADHPHAAEK